MPIHQPEPEDSPPGLMVRLAPGVAVREEQLRFAFSRSSGPGGQNVNKLSTRAELRIGLTEIPLPPAARARLARLAGRRLTDAGELLIVSQSERSQSGNKADCVERLRELVLEAQVQPKIRRPTKPTKGSQARRVEAKRRRSDIKRKRGSGGSDE